MLRRGRSLWEVLLHQSQVVAGALMKVLAVEPAPHHIIVNVKE
jgi:hypothetical protein